MNLILAFSRAFVEISCSIVVNIVVCPIPCVNTNDHFITRGSLIPFGKANKGSIPIEAGLRELNVSIREPTELVGLGSIVARMVPH